MSTAVFTPKFISFDCYGTLTRFRMTEMATAFYADRLAAEALPAFCKDWATYRFDEVLGPWKPYSEVVANSLARCSKKWGVEFREEEAKAVYEAIPTWGPHDDVAGGLSKICDKIPLVILSNAMNDQIMDNVAKLGATFHRVY
ncbi:MAG: dehalogenase, partial [Novosphingobium sp. 16-62-11]